MRANRTTPQSVYKAENLTEGEHTLYAVTQKERSGSAVVNQGGFMYRSHTVRTLQKILNWKIRDFLSVGQSYAISYSYTPSYATLNDMSYITLMKILLLSVNRERLPQKKRNGSDHGIQPEGRGFPEQWKWKCESREV